MPILFDDPGRDSNRSTVRWQVSDNDRIRSNNDIITNVYRAKDLRACADQDIISKGWHSASRILISDRHSLADRTIFADLHRSNDRSKAIANIQPCPNDGHKKAQSAQRLI
jgi:hypothetical protein